MVPTLKRKAVTEAPASPPPAKQLEVDPIAVAPSPPKTPRPAATIVTTASTPAAAAAGAAASIPATPITVAYDDIPNFPLENPEDALYVANVLMDKMGYRFSSADLGSLFSKPAQGKPMFVDPTTKTPIAFCLAGTIETSESWPSSPTLLNDANKNKFGHLVNAKSTVNVHRTANDESWNPIPVQCDKLVQLHPASTADNPTIPKPFSPARNHGTTIPLNHSMVTQFYKNTPQNVIALHDPADVLANFHARKLYVNPLSVNVVTLTDDGHLKPLGPLANPSHLKNCFGIFKFTIDMWQNEADGRASSGITFLTNDLILLYKNAPAILSSTADFLKNLEESNLVLTPPSKRKH